jgi:hypothetical protein
VTRRKPTDTTPRRVELLEQLDNLNAVLVRLGAFPLVPKIDALDMPDSHIHALVAITQDHIITVTRALKGHTA